MISLPPGTSDRDSQNMGSPVRSDILAAAYDLNAAEPLSR